jgi:hypothetical protein
MRGNVDPHLPDLDRAIGLARERAIIECGPLLFTLDPLAPGPG